MLKIMLKEPVPDAFFQESAVPARAAQFILVRGTITEKFVMEISGEEWLSFIEPAGNPVLIPKSNIAYIQEQLPNANQKVS